MTALSLDMDSNDLYDWISSNGAVHVVFNAKSEEMECYPEEGIQAIITGVLKNDDDVHKWTVDYTLFEVLNSLHESKNYYGPSPELSRTEKKLAYLSAYATSFYKRKDTLYVDNNSKLSKVLKSIQPAKSIEVTAETVEKRFAAIQQALGSFSI